MSALAQVLLSPTATQVSPACKATIRPLPSQVANGRPDASATAGESAADSAPSNPQAADPSRNSDSVQSDHGTPSPAEGPSRSAFLNHLRRAQRPDASEAQDESGAEEKGRPAGQPDLAAILCGWLAQDPSAAMVTATRAMVTATGGCTGSGHGTGVSANQSVAAVAVDADPGTAAAIGNKKDSAPIVAGPAQPKAGAEGNALALTPLVPGDADQNASPAQPDGTAAAAEAQNSTDAKGAALSPQPVVLAAYNTVLDPQIAKAANPDQPAQAPTQNGAAADLPKPTGGSENQTAVPLQASVPQNVQATPQNVQTVPQSVQAVPQSVRPPPVDSGQRADEAAEKATPTPAPVPASQIPQGRVVETNRLERPQASGTSRAVQTSDASAVSVAPAPGTPESERSGPQSFLQVTGLQPGQAAPAEGPSAPGASTAAAPADPKTEVPRQVLDQIAQAVRAEPGPAGRQVVIHLNPPELGSVRMTFRSDGDGVRCSLQVESAHTFHQIQHEVPALAGRLADSGVHFKGIEITLREPGGSAASNSTLQDGSAGRNPTQTPWQQDSPPSRDAGQPVEAAAAAGTPSLSWAADDAVNVWR